MVNTLLLSLAVLMTAQPTTVRISVAAGIEEVTFDPTRVSPAELNRWFELSPNDDRYLIPAWIEMCYSDDPRYVPCRPEPIVANVHNARLNLAVIRQHIEVLQSKRYPPALAPVVAYLLQVQSFALWKESRRLRFIEHFDTAVFTSPYMGIDPKVECATALQKIRSAPDHTTASIAARVEWGFCMYKANERRIGSYPDKIWQDFLAAHGIREHLIPETVDD